MNGRLRIFQQFQDAPDTFAIGLEFNEIDWPGHTGIFLAQPVSVEPIPGLSSSLFHGATRTLNTMAGPLTNSIIESISPASIPGVATFFLSGSRVIPKGFKMTWRTRETKHL